MTAVAVRLVRLHAASRRLPAALALLAVCAVGLRAVLYGHWDDYGALQLPLIFEAACAAIIAVTAGSPFGEPERATRWNVRGRDDVASRQLGGASLGGIGCGGTWGRVRWRGRGGGEGSGGSGRRAPGVECAADDGAQSCRDARERGQSQGTGASKH